MPRKGQSREDQKNRGRGASSVSSKNIGASEVVPVPVVSEVKKVVEDAPVVKEEKVKPEDIMVIHLDF